MAPWEPETKSNLRLVKTHGYIGLRRFSSGSDGEIKGF